MNLVQESFERLADNASTAAHWGDFWDDEGPPFVAQYQLDGQNGGTWHVAVAISNCTVREGRAEKPDVTLMLSDADWLDVVAGRSSFWRLLASGRVTVRGEKVSGEVDLLAELGLLGLLGPPVTAKDVEAADPQCFLDAWWVVPRVLSAGRIDFYKWCYFASAGDLRLELSRLTWGALVEARPSWRHTLIECAPPAFVWRAAFTVFFPVILIPIIILGPPDWFGQPVVFAILKSSLFSAVLATAFFLSALLNVVPASGVLTRFARLDRDFFNFAIERRLMKIRPGWIM